MSIPPPIHDRVMAQAKQSIGKFRVMVTPMEWMPRGVLTSEGFALCTMCDLYDVDAIVESGVRNGRSTNIMRRYLPKATMTVLDWEMSATSMHNLEHMGIVAYREDSMQSLLDHVESLKLRRVGVFIDGPKGDEALKLAAECIRLPHVQFVGVHDLPRLMDGRPYEARANLKRIPKFDYTDGRIFDDHWLTDRTEFVMEYAWLDTGDSQKDHQQGTQWFPYTRLERGKEPTPLGSYGYTIGFLCK